VQALLDKVLSSGSGGVLKRTMARLPAADAAPMLTALVARLSRGPSRAAALLPWLRAVLTVHASALATAAGGRDAMAVLSQLAATRAALLHPMLALRGRLDVLLAAADAAQPAGVAAAHLAPLVRPCCLRAPACLRLAAQLA
jgi:U3 small nucleolar RNA-associated protein 5